MRHALRPHWFGTGFIACVAAYIICLAPLASPAAAHSHSHVHSHSHSHSHARSHTPSHTHSHDHHPSPSSNALLKHLASLPPSTAAYISSFLTSLASLAGVLLLPLPSAATGLIAVAFLAFAAGALLADAALHLLPTIYAANPETAGYGLLAGVASFFFIDRIISALGHTHTPSHTHHHHSERTDHDSEPTSPDSKLRRRNPEKSEKPRKPKPRRKSRPQSPSSATSSSSSTPPSSPIISPHAISAAYLNLAADGLHNFCDGLSVGAAYRISHASGAATTLAVFLHEVPQELGDYMLLLRGGFSRPAALAANFACALCALAGTWASLRIGAEWEGVLLPFCGGGLLFMAVGAVLPELGEAVDGKGRGGAVGRSVLAAVCGAAGVAMVTVIESAAHGAGGHSH